MNLEDIISGWNGCVCSGEGGGGDLTTAQVTFINSAEGTSYTVYPPFYFIADGVIGTTLSPLTVAESLVLTVPLGENGAVWQLSTIDDINYDVLPTATGDVTIDFDNFAIIITGDGTITAAGSGGIA